MILRATINEFERRYCSDWIDTRISNILVKVQTRDEWSGAFVPSTGWRVMNEYHDHDSAISERVINRVSMFLMRNPDNPNWHLMLELIKFETAYLMKWCERDIHVHNIRLRVMPLRIECAACNTDLTDRWLPSTEGVHCSCCGGVIGCCCECEYCERCERRVPCLSSCCGFCDDCCQCRECSACGNRRRGFCENCDFCGGCCTCPRCLRSGWALEPKHRCNGCGFHQRYCACNDKGTYREYLTHGNGGRKQPKHIGKYQPGMSKRTIGVELEFSSYSTEQVMKKKVLGVLSKWGAFGTYDGCVPNGFEVVTAPASCDAFYRQIDEICNAVTSCRISNRCGLHIHIGAEDFSWYDIRKLLHVYSQTESMLYEMCEDGRYDNHFSKANSHLYSGCIKCQPSSFKRELFGALYGLSADSEHELRNRKYVDCRYGGLNLHAYTMQKTFEFRHHEGTKNAERIKAWGMALAKLVDVAKAMSDIEIDLLLNSRERWVNKLTAAERAELGV